MFKKNKQNKKLCKLTVKQERLDKDVYTIEYSNYKKIRYKYSKRKKHLTAVMIGFDSGKEKIEYTDIISVSKKIYRGYI